MPYLLDINVLIALFDTLHAHHQRAHAWWAERSSKLWISCPITENGFVRVVSNPAYKSVNYTANEAIEKLRLFQKNSRHEFWSDSISLADDTIFEANRLMGHRQLTDIYLLGLAHANSGTLVTFDRSVSKNYIINSHDDLIEVIQ